MKNAKFFKYLPLLLLFCVSCTAPKEQKTDLLCASVWYFPQAPVPVYLNFTPDGRVLGSMGVNHFFAPLKFLPKGEFEIGEIACTRMGQLPEFSERFFKALRSARFRRKAKGKVELYSKDLQLVMILSPVPAQ